MSISTKKIIPFVLLLNILCLPHTAHSESSCLEALKKLSQEELDRRLFHLLHDELRALETLSFNLLHDDEFETPEKLSEEESKHRLHNEESSKISLLDKVQALIQAGADVNLKEYWLNPLTWSMGFIDFYDTRLTHMLLEYPEIDVNEVADAPPAEENTPLTYSIIKLNEARDEKELLMRIDITRKIIEHPGFHGINIRNGDEDTALSYLLRHFDSNKTDYHTMELLEELGYSGQELSSATWDIESYMDVIDKLIVEPIIKHPKFDPDLTFGRLKNTVLHYAIYEKRTHVARLLIELPEIDLNPRNEEEYTPMMFANLYDQRDIAKLIFKKLTFKQRVSYLKDIAEMRNMQN